MADENITPEPEGQTEPQQAKTYTQAELDEIVNGLRQKNSELLTETKAEREKRQQLESSQLEAERKAAEERGQYKELYSKTTEQLEKERQEKMSILQQMQEKDINLAVSGISAGLAQDEKRRAVLEQQIRSFTKYKDGAPVYEIGGIEVTKDALVDHIKGEFAFLCDAGVGSGGGATGSNSGAGVKTMKRTDFDKLPPSEQMNFMRSGGKVN